MTRVLMMALAVTAAGCGVETTGVATAMRAPDREGLGWEQSSTFECGSVSFGGFSGADSVESYRLQGSAGIRYTIDMRGFYNPTHGAAISVLAAGTDELVGYASNWWAAQTSLDFAPTADGEFDVVVSPLWSWASGGYSVGLECAVTNLPECSPTPPVDAVCWEQCANGYYVASWGVSCGCC